MQKYGSRKGIGARFFWLQLPVLRTLARTVRPQRLKNKQTFLPALALCREILKNIQQVFPT
jgi:hypothetical protein